MKNTVGNTIGGTPRRSVAVIGALDEEVALIAGALADVHSDRLGGVEVSHGMLNPHGSAPLHVAATVGGMGTVNAAATAQLLIDAYRPQAVIFSGIAGNLNPALHVNDVVLGGTLRYLDSDMRLIAQSAPKTDEFHSDTRLLKLADQALDELGMRHITGVIATGNYFVDTPEQIAAVTRATGADAVEMEGAAICHVAARNGVPALVIRALSDNADTDYEVFKEFDLGQYANVAARVVLRILELMRP